MTTATAPVVSIKQVQDRLAKVPKDRFIGAVVLFSITGMVTHVDYRRVVGKVQVTSDDLAEWFEEYGLDPRFLPLNTKKVDAFRKATSEVKDEYTVNEDQTAVLMVREVKYDDEVVIRHVVREVRDRRTEKLKYDEHVATLKFFRGVKRNRGKPNSGEHWKHTIMPKAPDQKRVLALIAEARSRYDAIVGYLQSDDIRGVIRDYLTEELNAIRVVPSGGGYFVAKMDGAPRDSIHPVVDKLQALVTDKIGQGCTFYQLPLVDTIEQRQMLTDAFQDEVVDKVRLLTKKISQFNESGRELDPKRYAEFASEYQDLLVGAEAYTDKLGLAQGRAGSALEMAMIAVNDLAERL